MKRLLAAAFVLAGAAAVATAQEYPARTVTIVSPTTAGTGADILARTLAPRLQQRFGRPFVVENRTGASGNIGVGSVAKGAADGHLLLSAPSTMAITPLMSRDLGWDPVRDLQPIARAAFLTMSLVVHPSVAASNANEFIALAKAKPGALNYASPGNGTPQHLTMELLKLSTKIEITHVPYKGTAGAATDLLGGRVDAAFFPIHVVLQHLKAGKLRVLATVSERRSPYTPEVATLREQGIEGVDIESWIGLFAPRGTPPAILGRLTQEILAILALEEVRSALFEQGIITNPGGQEAMAATLAADLERYRKVINQAKLTLD